MKEFWSKPELLFLFGFQFSFTQDKIEFLNASFEGEEGQSAIPLGWYSCLTQGIDGPDTHTARSNVWRVRRREMHGKSFVSLRADDQGKIQSLSTQLIEPLDSNGYYEFSIYLSKPERMLVSQATSTQIDKEEENGRRRRGSNSVSFNKPLVLQVWASRSACEFTELLAVTSAIFHTDWRKYKIRFQSNDSFEYLHLVANYIVEESYNGALFVDNCSPLIRTDSSYSAEETPGTRQHYIDSLVNLKSTGKDRIRKRITDDLYVKEDKMKGNKVSESFLYDFSILGIMSKYEISDRGVRNGEAITYSLKNGKEIVRSNYEDNVLHGWQYSYYDNGATRSVRKFDKGKQVGVHTHYYDNGEVLIRVDWGEGEYIKNILELNTINGKLIDIREFRKNFIEYFTINDDMTISFYLPLKGEFEVFDLKENL